MSTEAQTPVEALDLAAASLEVALAVEAMREECATCGGRKVVEHLKPPPGPPYVFEAETCPFCEGRGWVPVQDLATLLGAMTTQHSAWDFANWVTKKEISVDGREHRGWVVRYVPDIKTVADEDEGDWGTWIRQNAPDPTLAAFRAAVAALRAREENRDG